MNFSSYGSVYSWFHGCTTYGIENEMIVLEFAHMSWETWLTLRFYKYDKILLSDEDRPLVQALKIHFKTEAPVSIVCKQDSCSILLGKEYVVVPKQNDSQSLSVRLYATPYYIDPNMVATYLQGVSRPAYDNVYAYKNTILYLDGNDVPFPGGCYYDKPKMPPTHYRLCILTDAPVEHVVSIVNEWAVRRGVMKLPYLSQEALAIPKFLSFTPEVSLDFESTDTLSSNKIKKVLSLKRPSCLIQDVMESYLRRQSPDFDVSNLGLVMEWPLRVAFNSARIKLEEDAKPNQTVAIAINGQRPNRIISVRAPYKRYFEYDAVLSPNTAWTLISYERSFLKVPEDVEKVSIDSIVIGLSYKGAFFCLGKPLLEGRPCTESQRNVEVLFTPATEAALTGVRVLETYKYNQTHSLHRVYFNTISYDAWCLAPTDEAHAYAHQLRIPSHVRMWLDSYDRHHNSSGNREVISTNLVRLAILLAHHMICFTTKIVAGGSTKDDDRRIEVSDTDIEIWLEEKAADFINKARVMTKGSEEAGHSKTNCTLM